MNNESPQIKMWDIFEVFKPTFIPSVHRVFTIFLRIRIIISSIVRAKVSITKWLRCLLWIKWKRPKIGREIWGRPQVTRLLRMSLPPVSFEFLSKVHRFFCIQLLSLFLICFGSLSFCLGLILPKTTLSIWKLSQFEFPAVSCHFSCCN